MFLRIAFRVSHSAVTVHSCAGGIGGGGVAQVAGFSVVLMYESSYVCRHSTDSV